MTQQQQFARSPLAAALTLATAALLYSPATTAQTPPASAASEAVSDRVKKDAAGPLYWIRLNAQKSDASGTKTAPRITEVRTEPRAPRAAPTQATATVAAPTTPPVRSTTAVAASLGYLPAEASVRDAAASSAAAQVTPAAAEAAPNTAATLSPNGVAGAGMVAPSVPGAAEVARATAAAASTAAATDEDDPDDQPLALMKAEEPEFPANMMRKLRKGTVQVRFEVQADGTVANASVLQTSHRSLNEAAISAVSGWRFQPVRSPRSAVVDLGFDLDG